MITRIFSAALVCLFAVMLSAQAAPRTEVMVVATMHRLHAKSTTYSYDTLYALLRATKPDYIGVEIRSEDISRSDAYLAKNYPPEMIEAAKQWGSRAFGFDWLGDDVAGAPVPEDWWAKRSPVKQLERDMDKDPAFQSAALDAIQAQEMAILKDATPASLNDGRYDRLNDSYYAAFRKLVHGSKYQALAEFYAARDRHIGLNIVTTVRSHPGARIVLLTGADHRSVVLRYLRDAFGPELVILPVP